MKHRYSDLPLAPPKPRRKPEVRKDGTLREPSPRTKKRILLELCKEQKWRCYLCKQFILIT